MLLYGGLCPSPALCVAMNWICGCLLSSLKMGIDAHVHELISKLLEWKFSTKMAQKVRFRIKFRGVCIANIYEMAYRVLVPMETYVHNPLQSLPLSAEFQNKAYSSFSALMWRSTHVNGYFHFFFFELTTKLLIICEIRIVIKPSNPNGSPNYFKDDLCLLFVCINFTENSLPLWCCYFLSVEPRIKVHQKAD